jgi:hypothetical protein
VTARARLTAAVVLLLAAGCADDVSPAQVQDGSYRLFATSESTSVDAAGASELLIDADTVSLTDGANTSTVVLGEPTDERVVCPPSGEGSPLSMDVPLSVDGVTFTRPALFGDCGQTTPVRVTLVDLESTDTSLRFPFTRWAEFCDVTDPDC